MVSGLRWVADVPLSGAFLRAKRVPDPNQATLHQADPTHFEYGAGEEADTEPPVWEAPPYHETAPARPVLGFEWIANTPGVTFPEPGGHDQAPGRSHDDGGISSRNLEPAVQWQHSDERYESDSFDGLPGSVSTLPHEVHARGLNAEGQNNPSDEAYGGEGFRRGRYTWWNVHRRFSPPWRVHDRRMVGAWTATQIGDATPPENAGPYNSPFSSLARARRNLYARPQMRRIPPGFDDAVVTDGSESIAAGPPPLIGGQWVAG